MGTELKEDILISILRMTEGEHPVSEEELAAFMDLPLQRIHGVSTVLSDEGCVMISGSAVSLTDKGLLLAREVRKKHHVMENFLVDVLGMDQMSAHKEACRMEHSMSQDSMRRFCDVTGNKVDKDCSACIDPCSSAISVHESVMLADMPLHKKGRIAFLRGGSTEDTRKLMSMGFVPGRTVSVESRISENGPRVVSLGDAVIALDVRFARSIYVDAGER